MRIYIASSYRNLAAVQKLRDSLLEQGHQVVDWTLLTPPIAPHLPQAERKKLLDSDNSGRIFAFCSEACASVDLVIYLGPSGQDAALEVGMAYAAGVPVLGLLGEDEKPGLMINGCVKIWAENMEEALSLVGNEKDVFKLADFFLR